MAFYYQTFEHGLNGNNITSTIRGGGNYFDLTHTGTAGAVTFSNTTAMHGSISAYCDAGGTGDWAALEWNAEWSATYLSVRAYFRFPSWPSGDLDIISIRSGSSHAGLVRYETSTNYLKVINSGSVTVKTFSSSALSLDTWYRVEFVVGKGTTTSNGTIKCAIFSGDSATPLETAYSTTATNTGTSNVDSARFGIMSSTNIETGYCYLDSVAAYDVSYFLGPVPIKKARPVATLSNDGAWTITGGSTVNEVTADDSDSTYITSPDDPVDDTTVVQITNLDSGIPVVMVRAKCAGSAVLTTTLKEGTTTIASWQDTLTTSWVTYTHALTPTESSSITDRNNLFVQVEAD